MGVNIDVQRNHDTEYMTALHKYAVTLNYFLYMSKNKYFYLIRFLDSLNCLFNGSVIHG